MLNKNMLILIVLLPLIGFFSASLFGRFLGIGSCYITVLNTFLSFLLSCFFLYKIIFLGASYKIVLSSWICSDLLHVNWGFLFDSLTVIMLFVITFISTLVHLYSLEYMEHDPHLIRFMSYLSLFTFFMLILVTADNFLQMFVGWEGVGLSSYLLINFWFTRIQANKSAIKAMLVNRVGDFSILLGIFLIFFVFNSLEYDVVFSLAGKVVYSTFNFFGYNFSYIDFITFFLFLGAMGKSAQLGLHTWLPDAMEGPTPVSALIHAATMVTAGVFLIVRCSFLFELSSFTLNVILIVGSVTTFFSSTVGLFQNDIKKIIAYSTCSQLGYMIFACGLSSYDVAMFHLSNHAFFKALLFLSAGAVIHAVGNEQDIRKFGGLRLKLPLTYSVMLIGSLALMGFPFLSGFYSKDLILELAYSKYTVYGHFSYVLGTLSVFSTSFYSIRLLYLVFLAEPNGTRETILLSHEPQLKMLLPLCLLCFLSVFIGFLTKDLFVGFGSSFWNNSIFILPANNLFVDIEFISILFKTLPLILSFLGAYAAYYIYTFKLNFLFQIKSNFYFLKFYNFLNRRWYFDRIYNQFISQSVLTLSYSFFYKEIDRGLIEQFGPFGLINILKYQFTNIKEVQSGSLFNYLFIFFLYCLIFVLFIVYFSFFFKFLNILFLFLVISFIL
jgi:NADH-ubiquinone oxidoreductase chain 5